jgi:MtN3 and saliva related transmembrane protein
MIAKFVHVIFGLSLFFNAAIFIPQAIKILKKKNAKGLSLFTFIGFNIMQLFAVWHGYFVHDYILMSGFFLSFITCGVVTLLILRYG